MRSTTSRSVSCTPPPLLSTQLVTRSTRRSAYGLPGYRQSKTDRRRQVWVTTAPTRGDNLRQGDLLVNVVFPTLKLPMATIPYEVVALDGDRVTLDQPKSFTDAGYRLGAQRRTTMQTARLVRDFMDVTHD